MQARKGGPPRSRLPRRRGPRSGSRPSRRSQRRRSATSSARKRGRMRSTITSRGRRRRRASRASTPSDDLVDGVAQALRHAPHLAPVPASPAATSSRGLWLSRRRRTGAARTRRWSPSSGSLSAQSAPVGAHDPLADVEAEPRALDLGGPPVSHTREGPEEAVPCRRPRCPRSPVASPAPRPTRCRAASRCAPTRRPGEYFTAFETRFSSTSEMRSRRPSTAAGPPVAPRTRRCVAPGGMRPATSADRRRQVHDGEVEGEMARSRGESS